MSDTVTQLELWRWLRKNGPVAIDTAAEKMDADRESVAAAMRSLMYTGHATYTIDRKAEARALDDLRPLCEPFGAGIGEVVSGDEPPDEPGR